MVNQGLSELFNREFKKKKGVGRSRAPGCQKVGELLKRKTIDNLLISNYKGMGIPRNPAVLSRFR
jgi:hypothetical protein